MYNSDSVAFFIQVELNQGRGNFRFVINRKWFITITSALTSLKQNNCTLTLRWEIYDRKLFEKQNRNDVFGTNNFSFHYVYSRIDGISWMTELTCSVFLF